MTEPDYAALESRLKELEAAHERDRARLQELEDIREINEVFYFFHDACTGGFFGRQAGRMEALDVLTDDATIEVQGELHEVGNGPKGREEFTKYWDFYYGDAGPLPYVFQTSVAEKVTVTGDTAVQKSNMLGIFQVRGEKPRINLAKRTNDFVRTPEGWRIRKTTIEGGFSIYTDELNGFLNELPPAEEREEWKPPSKR